MTLINRKKTSKPPQGKCFHPQIFRFSDFLAATSTFQHPNFCVGKIRKCFLCLAHCLQLVCAVMIVHLLIACRHLRICPRSLIDKVCVCVFNSCLCRLVSASDNIIIWLSVHFHFHLFNV